MEIPALYAKGLQNKDREFIFRTAANRLGLPAYIIEKDYIVCIVLKIIFTIVKPVCLEITDTPFLFKGGTSLSKAYNTIFRMSEDIDLSISMDYLRNPEPEIESNSARSKRVEELRKGNEIFVDSVLKEAFITNLASIHSSFTVKVDSGETQNIIIGYPKSLANEDYTSSYIKPQVLIETGGRASFEPHNEKYIVPFALKEILHVLSKNDDCCSLVNVLGMDRTFFEKLTLLHEMNNRTVEDVRSRQSRHIYDLIMIYKQNPDVVTNLSLLEDVRTHKKKYFRRSSARWDDAIPGKIRILPTEDIYDKLKSDWERMADLFPSSALPYTFETLIMLLHDIDQSLNG